MITPKGIAGFKNIGINSLLLVVFLLFEPLNAQRKEITTPNDTIHILPNKRYTIPVTFFNPTQLKDSLRIFLKVPGTISVFHNIPENTVLERNSKKLSFILLKTNSKVRPALYPLKLHYGNGKIKRVKTIYINLQEEERTEASAISFPEEVKSDEEFYIKYLIKNTGNIADTLQLTYTNAVVGDDINKTWVLAPGKDFSIELPFFVPEQGVGKSYFMAETHYRSLHNGKLTKIRKSIPVYHSTHNNDEDRLTFPVTAGIKYFNNSLPEQENQSHFQFEFSGSGYIDTIRNKKVDFTLRGPSTLEQPRFGSYDQYSVNYTSEKLHVTLGDYPLKLNVLSLQGRWVRGAEIKTYFNQKNSIKAFYGRPRFFAPTNTLYGATYSYTNNKNFSYFLEWLQKEEDYKNKLHNGWIGTGGFNYKREGFTFQGLFSYSNTDAYKGHGFQINPQFRDDHINASIDYLYASKDFFGYYNDSELLNARFHYNFLKRLRIGIGYNQAQYNRQLGDLEFNTQPQYNMLFSDVRWYLKSTNYIQFKLYRRNNKDQAINATFNYKESGIRGILNWNFNRFNANIQNTISETVNYLITKNHNSGTSYNTRLALTYNPFNRLSVKPYTEHLATNRFNQNSSINETYWYYGLSVNYRTENFNGSVFWRNSYAKDELYKDRSFFNALLNYNINKRGLLSLSGGYTVFPSPLENKDLYFSLGYRHRFDIPLEKNRDKFSLMGDIRFYGQQLLNKTGIRFRVNNDEVVTNQDGHFVIRNIKTPSVRVDIDKNTLPAGYLTFEKFPQIVDLMENDVTRINLTLIKESSLKGSLSVKKAPYSKLQDFKIYLKLSNEDYQYFAEVNKKSIFRFMHIIPGTYKLEIINNLKKDRIEIVSMTDEVTLLPGKTKTENIELKETERKIRFVKLKK